MITIAVTNQKGGVGKTTIAFNLAQILASRPGSSVLAIDNDPQGNLTSSFLEDPSALKANILDTYDGKRFEPQQISKGLYLMGANINLAPVAERDFQVIFKLKEAFENLENDPNSGGFDYVVIDCPPAFGHLHLAALNAVNYALVPVKPAPYALKGIADLLATVEKARKYLNPDLKILGIIVNQVDGRKLVMEREMEAALRETFGWLVLRTKISKRIKLEESPAFQQSITKYDPKGPSGRELRAMVKELLSRIKGG